MGLAIIGINTEPERDQSGTASFPNRRLNFETGNVRSLPEDGNSTAAHECGSRAIVRLHGDAPVEDRLGACSHLAEITARMDRPQTVRALHPTARVCLGSWRKEFLVGRAERTRGIRARFPGAPHGCASHGIVRLR